VGTHRDTAAVIARTFFFQGINLKKSLATALAMGLAVAVLNGLADVKRDGEGLYGWLEFLQNLSLYASCSLLGLVLAEKAPLQVFLVRRTTTWVHKAALLFLFGVLPGTAVGMIYHNVFFQYRLSPRLPLRVKAVQTYYDSFIVSLRAGVTEELVFRFLLMTAFFYILKKAFFPLAAQGFTAARWIPFLFSLLLSSLLFGFVHGAYGFMTAFLAGLVLGLVYFRAGLESAIVAHFMADLVFFSMTYLR
jgi:membrane protease YdiL (CAAX protease family)